MLFNEKMLTLDEAAKHLPGQRSKSSLYRWWRHGYNGVRLECRRIGRNLYTSLEALERFSAQLAKAATEDVPSPATESTMNISMPAKPVTKAQNSVQNVLERAGIRLAV